MFRNGYSAGVTPAPHICTPCKRKERAVWEERTEDSRSVTKTTGFDGRGKHPILVRLLVCFGGKSKDDRFGPSIDGPAARSLERSGRIRRSPM